MGFDGDSDDDEDEAGPDGDFVPPSANLMSGLMVCGSAIRPTTPQVSSASLPGCADEDYLMDEILEDTGMAFGKCDNSLDAGPSMVFNPKKNGRAGSLASMETDFDAALSDLLDLTEESDDSEDEQPRRPSRQSSRDRSVRFASAVEV